MKKLLYVTMLLLCLVATSQDIKNTLYLYNDPNAMRKDGFNFGIGFDYQRQFSFNSINLFVFPQLRGKDYTELTFSHGINVHLGRFNTERLFMKIKVGGIWRETLKAMPFGFIGFEAGNDIYIGKGVYIGSTYGIDYRTDSRTWGARQKHYWSKYAQIKIGFDL